MHANREHEVDADLRRWLMPTTIAEIEFAEWTPDDRLRHASFIGLRHDKSAWKVVRET
jgi:bifunctional non-homologous end joining protein LigD